MQKRRPNILFLMADQMQASVLDPASPCPTPALDRLAARGVRFANAYTPCPICSPARASLMTGLLPHNHGVLEAIHAVDEDQSVLRGDGPHWAQLLAEAGYRTGYFGKWHVERSARLENFGWREYLVSESRSFGELLKERAAQRAMQGGAAGYERAKWIDGPPGYPRGLLYAVTGDPPECRGMGVVADFAERFLERALASGEPWCCFVSFREPHDPFVCGRAAFERIDAGSIALSPSRNDPLADRPGLYRRARRIWSALTERERYEAAACYYGTISELDGLIGRLVGKVDEAGQLDETIVVVTSDHGELLGAHGLYCKTISAFEELYKIPLIVAGPGVARGVTSAARIGLHDLCPTIVEMTGVGRLETTDPVSFAQYLQDPGSPPPREEGFAEYHGGRYRVTQRVLWHGPWKLVFNGFDFDELYHLEDDPWELRNLAVDPQYAGKHRELMGLLWEQVRVSRDRSLLHSHYPALHLAEIGPGL